MHPYGTIHCYTYVINCSLITIEFESSNYKGNLIQECHTINGFISKFTYNICIWFTPINLTCIKVLLFVVTKSHCFVYVFKYVGVLTLDNDNVCN